MKQKLKVYNKTQKFQKKITTVKIIILKGEMISQQILTKKVVEYLRDNHNIRLNLPNLYRSIDSKVTLKYLKSFRIAKNQNRYKVLVDKTDDLLKKNLLNLQRIKMFSQDFFNTITQDIIILEQNQKLRRKIPFAKDQILYKNQEIGGFQQNIKTQCLLINDKQDVLAFISGNLKNYLTKLSIISQEYNNINKFEVLTSINIDDLYQDSLADEEDYNKHYLALLQVLHKLKSNMIKLYQQIQNCDPYDVPLRCVNFLANCKNLISELEPFVVNHDCIFNRLIFYIVKCQKENLELVASNYEQALQFSRQIVSDLFKICYLGFMFQDTYRQVKQHLQESRQSLLKLVNDQQLGELKMNQTIKHEFANLQLCRSKIKEIKRIIGVGKDGCMRQYVRKKQCKKLTRLIQSKQQYHLLKKMIQKFCRYYKIKKQIQILQNKQIQQSSKIIKQIRILQKINDIMVGLSNNNRDEKQKITPQKRFESTFIKLQQDILEVNTLKSTLQIEMKTISHHEDIQGHQLLIQYLTHRIQHLSTITHNYLQLQTKLLNTYITIQAQTQKRQQQSKEIKQKTLSQIESFFQTELKSHFGFQITNEDGLCQIVQQKIKQLGKAEYMIKKWKKDEPKQILQGAIKNDEEDIRYYRNNLEWLLTIFQGSMDQKIFQLIMDKLDFDSQDYLQRQKKVQQLINQLAKYLKDLKQLIKSHPLSQIHPKIYKIIKDRIQLYQIISDIYNEGLLVFKQTKKKDPLYNIENKGLMLFDQNIFKFVLNLYQFKNKLRMEMEQLKELMLPARTKNYLVDELYQPFMIRYGQFVNFKEEELLNFTLRLQHALNIETSQKKIITVFEEYLGKPYNQDYFSNLQNLCKQMVQIKQENQLVIKLENQPVVVHNLAKFKELVHPFFQYYSLAEQVSKDLQKCEDLKLTKKLEINNQKVINLRNIIMERWLEHKKQNDSNKAPSRIDSRPRTDSKSRIVNTNRQGSRINQREEVQSRLLNISGES